MPIAAIISKPHHPELKTLVPKVVAWLKAHDFDVIADHESQGCGADCRVMDRAQLASARPQFAIVLGGDGTLLSAARALAENDIPILGVNLGSLGFLTEVALEDLFTTLDGVVAGSATADSRTMIHCAVQRGGKPVASHIALNDAVVSKGAIARIADFDVFVDGALIANYKADGIIVATPTGSTAYSLAAGGPIVGPDVDAFVITPVSPHALTNRPLVVRDTAKIELVVKNAGEEVVLTLDGQIAVPLKEGDRLTCTRSEHAARLLRVKPRSFFEVLRMKLKWGER